MLNDRFSKGIPRRGQWVLIGDRLAIATPGVLNLPPDQVALMLVNADGFDDVAIVAPLADCAPLLDKSRIPEPRRATMAADWQPRP
ncbi:MAG: hypothetical protein RL030_2801 [Pseudomonadota bacterium]|jgi:hypothetical protein